MPRYVTAKDKLHHLVAERDENPARRDAVRAEDD